MTIGSHPLRSTPFTLVKRRAVRALRTQGCAKPALQPIRTFGVRPSASAIGVSIQAFITGGVESVASRIDVPAGAQEDKANIEDTMPRQSAKHSRAYSKEICALLQYLK
jgi:hypothetical protein